MQMFIDVLQTSIFEVITNNILIIIQILILYAYTVYMLDIHKL